jgi:hypothetical protein
MTMRILNIVIVSSLIGALSTPVWAGDLPAGIATTPAPFSASRVAAAAQATQEQHQDRHIPKGYLIVGSGLFVGGMTVALVGFLNNRNGSFPGFGEATSTNVKMGAAGLATAFGGGAILFLGTRKANQSTSLNFGPKGVSVSRRLSW